MVVLSLFGGMECGRITLSKMGIIPDIYYSAEIDKFARKEVAENFPCVIQLGDVTKWYEWDIDWSSIDLIIGGSPCQGFSFAGKQLAFNDPRSALFFEYVNILEWTKLHNPNVYYMLENVKMKRESLDVITKFMKVEPVFINSALVCAQNRQRYYWCNWYVPQPEDRGILLADILETDGDFTYMSDKFVERNKDILRDNLEGKARNLSAMEYVKNGRQGDYIKVGRVVGRKINPETGKRDDYNPDLNIKQRFEARSDDKCGTLTTVQKDNIVQIRDKSKCVRASGRNSFDRHEWGSISDCHYRKLTVIECCRLQGVPDDYFKVSSNTQAYKMLGNGWQCDTIEHIFSYCPLIKRLLY